ncbi:MAG: outer membrane protein transport protein [Thermodesulfobacteriota bacterium]|nr:outer membrane protein transport protein [Thermodesulfobacteriota bacterium]
MKRIFTFLSLLCLLLSVSSQLTAGGVDSKTNWSVEYIRTLNRNAATDSADIAAYNPAGVMRMDDGVYLNCSFHNILKTYTNEINGVDLETDTPSLVPGLFGIYKDDRWAGYAAFTIVGGGGKVEFKRGNATTSTIGLGLITGANATLAGFLVPADFWYTNIKSQDLDAESVYLGFTLGGSYALNDTVSVSLGARYTDAQREAEASLAISAANPLPGVNDDIKGVVDYEQEANGWCTIIGFNIAPSDELNIGLRYESKTKLDFEDTVKTDTLGILPSLGIETGNKARRDLPALLGLGVSYGFTPRVKIETTLTYYFQKDANWNGADRNVDDGYDLGVAIEYAFNDKLRGSLGYLYTDTGMKPVYMLPELPELNANSIGSGFVYEATDVLDLNFAVGRVFYQDDSFTSAMTGAKIRYEKEIYFLAFGIQYKFE